MFDLSISAANDKEGKVEMISSFSTSVSLSVDSVSDISIRTGLEYLSQIRLIKSRINKQNI